VHATGTGHGGQPAPVAACAGACPAGTALLGLDGVRVLAVTPDDGDWTVVDVVTDPATLESVQQGLKQKGYKIESAEVTMNASQLVSLDDARAPSVLKLLDALEEHDDVQSVYSNIDVPADVMERIWRRYAARFAARRR